MIDTGHYPGALFPGGVTPKLIVSPYVNSAQLDCPILNYSIVESASQQTLPSFLKPLNFTSLDSEKYVEMVDEYRFKTGNYNFNIKVDAKGGATFYSSYELSLIYDCNYDHYIKF